jgi:hypothetical protein
MLDLRAFARRLAITGGIAAALLAVTAPATLAGKPVTEPLEYPSQISFEAGDPCPFALVVDFLDNKEKVKTFTSNGWDRSFVSGLLVVRVSNPENGSSRVFNISGPGPTLQHDDGSSTVYFYGNSIVFGPGFMLATSGPAWQDYAADGSLTSTHTPRHVLDVCTVLS